MFSFTSRHPRFAPAPGTARPVGLGRIIAGIGLFAAHLSGSAWAQGTSVSVSATATVLRSTSVMEFFSPSMPLVAVDKTWSTLKIIAPVAPAPQAAGVVAGGDASSPAPELVPVSTALATTVAGGGATGSSPLLKGTTTAALQLMPTAGRASSDASGAMRLIVAFN
jgi:hypothetical protein